MSTILRDYIELSASMSNGKPTIYYGVGNKYKIKIGFITNLLLNQPSRETISTPIL